MKGVWRVKYRKMKRKLEKALSFGRLVGVCGNRISYTNVWLTFLGQVTTLNIFSRMPLQHKVPFLIDYDPFPVKRIFSFLCSAKVPIRFFNSLFFFIVKPTRVTFTEIRVKPIFSSLSPDLHQRTANCRYN